MYCANVNMPIVLIWFYQKCNFSLKFQVWGKWTHQVIFNKKGDKICHVCSKFLFRCIGYISTKLGEVLWSIYGWIKIFINIVLNKLTQIWQKDWRHRFETDLCYTYNVVMTLFSLSYTAFWSILSYAWYYNILTDASYSICISNTQSITAYNITYFGAAWHFGHKSNLSKESRFSDYNFTQSID